MHSPTGNLLADSAEGETPTIPSNVMKFSIEQAKTVDIPLTMKMLASPANKLEPSLEHKVDSVIRYLFYLNHHSIATLFILLILTNGNVST